MLENGWRDGPIYVLEILLYDPDGYYETNEPRVEMAKFEYEDIKHFSPGVSAASYYYLILRILKTGISLEAMPPWVSENGFSSFQAVC